LENRKKRFSLIRCFSAAHVSGKTKIFFDPMMVLKIIKADIYICLNYFLNHHRLKEHFCFSADMCGGKTPYKRKPHA
ncbi:MAG: hypothetical protein U0L88_01145, partial [Acutalibacteraceae bacterium]|nr:hypothetical protein [Acutalibacteraceae bacterium]